MNSKSKHQKNKQLLSSRYRVIDEEMREEIEQIMKGTIYYA